MHERVTLTRLIKRLVTPQKQKEMTSSTKDEREEMSGAISYTKFSGYYDRFD